MSSSTALDSIREVARGLGKAGRTPEWLSRKRARGLDEFLRLGFPGARDEHWKYTRLAALERKTFAATGMLAAPPRLPEDALTDLQGPRAVFVDGAYCETLSRTASIDGLRLLSLAQAISQDDALVRDELARVVARDQHRFASLSDALLTDGCVIDIAPGVKVDTPIYVLYLSTRSQDPTLCNPRTLIRVGENASATVIDHHLGTAGNQNLVNHISEVSLLRGAHLTHYSLQEASAQGYLVSGLHVSQGPDSHLVTHSLNLGGRMVRNDLHSRLEGSGAGIEMYGLYLAGDRQHVDNHTQVEHIATHTRSDQVYKGVLHGRGRAVFNGKAHIHPGAQGTEASQSNDNLLLSENAEIDTKPELEIYNDDVKCSHGATVGQLDQQALFYLRSRGIDEETARVLLTFAFAEMVLQRVGVKAVRERVEQLVIDLLPQSEKIREFV